MASPKKVVIAGESLLLTQTLTNLLRKEGLEVLVTKTGPQTMKIAEMEHPDMIILDVILPQMSGMEVLIALRNNGFRNPVVLLSDLMEEDIKRQGFQSGANTFIKKPINTEYLTKRVKELLGL